ncbi:O-succinylbenzoate synthase [Sporosarcina globispora]|uniref:o-succinylbenzoate synthase n=1 Tax=Sporosarcina globispora TaxID=1459 RepID=A0A0M0GLK7_SPOGL|nr:o-succinylbenzoate synthase [Sporosarcina globispora]KON90311.1 O-succinylbenzoate synthase [Sporosarcina globispora]
MNIKEIILRKLKMRMKHPFTTSFGTLLDRYIYLIEVVDENNISGWGESVAGNYPLYSEETVETTRHMLEDVLIPLLNEAPIYHPDEVNERFKNIRGNNIAKATIESAIWDLYAKQQNITLAEALGGERKQIEVGISLGIQDNIDELLALVNGFVTEGYKRIKIKIKPGKDVEVMQRVRDQFPDIQLMADANSAYTLNDVETLAKLDNLNLMMIEQPLAHDDIIDHAELQAQIKTPICLDESIHSLEDAKKAIRINSCKIINLKIGRVGGLTESKKIHDFCLENNIPLWCGGMLEVGVGRAHNIAMTSLTGFTLPGDTAASSRYWEEDIIDPEVTVNNGYINIPDRPGIGYEVNREKIAKYLLEEKRFNCRVQLI